MTSVLRTVQQTETPVGLMFFSEFNMNVIQKNIRQTFKDQTGISIDYQNPRDILALMRVAYINNSSDPWSTSVQQQVQKMNDAVIKTAMGQIGSNVTQYISYVRDISTPQRINDLPKNTSTYGKSMGAQSLWT
jgi:hypothetical protein